VLTKKKTEVKLLGHVTRIWMSRHEYTRNIFSEKLKALLRY